MQDHIRGRLLLTVLELLENAAYTSGEFLEAFLTSSKSDYRALRRLHRGTRPRQPSLRTIEQEERQRFHEVFYRLKCDGFVDERRHGAIARFTLSKRGGEKFAALKKKMAHLLPRRMYTTEPSNDVCIVSFDIPERERRKRDWLRAALANSGFRMIHKSVWLGKGKLSREFIEDLNALRLLPCVHIFAVTRRGTIARMS